MSTTFQSPDPTQPSAPCHVGGSVITQNTQRREGISTWADVRHLNDDCNLGGKA